ncbi:MAG: macro domain-containing protein [Myxococcales bacterium]|nr:macro domain-containing protein [Myxococcales bacterium]USN51040.1 MAG: macro domain-containing protein [Myxococcales bacterium]
MKSSSLLISVLLSFLSSCNHMSQPESLQLQEKNNTHKEEKNLKKADQEKVQLKDQTAFPKLFTKLPDLAQTGGWSKTLSTKAIQIPSDTPSQAQVFFSAQKNISGLKREISVVFGDLLKESGVIVNAANGGLEGGAGIDGLIHNAAKVDGQDKLIDEAIAYKAFHKINSFPTGSAMAMHSYGLGPAINMIIFTVGPQGASTPQTDLELFSATYNSLLKASEYKATSISIPTISTGIFAFPPERAAELYFGAILQFFIDHPQTSLIKVRLMDNKQDKFKNLGERFNMLFP